MPVTLLELLTIPLGKESTFVNKKRGIGVLCDHDTRWVLSVGALQEDR